ncbi:hypothetical protein V8G54_014060 [Vigna mungo]|uniref:Uncharacterized protein n=1 Tax=Vigna mungo TaxID=3915 RepID=A0AAQ3NGY8_VIGMU
MLETVFLGGNNFTFIPEGCFQGLRSLRSLSLADTHNLAPWAIPADLAQASNLVKLDLQGINLNVSGIKKLWLNNQIPEFMVLNEFEFWPNVPESKFRGLSGSIEIIAFMTNLSKVRLEMNFFTGPIPELSNCTTLVELILSHNYVTGVIPSSLMSLPSLKKISLDDNYFQGSYPSFGMGVKANVDDNFFCTHEPQPCDSQVIILLDILKHFGYPYRFASRWYGNNPCYHWTSIRCYEEKITIIDLANQNLSGTTSPAFAQLEILDVSHNNLFGNILKFSFEVKLYNNYNSFLGVSSTIPSSGGPNARDFSLSPSWITNIVLIGMVTIVVVVKWRRCLKRFNIMWHTRKRVCKCTNARTHSILLIARSLIANIAENYQQTCTRGGSSKGVHEIKEQHFQWKQHAAGEDPIPEISNCTTLVELILSHNYVTGVIPSSLMSLPSLKKISLDEYYFQGSYPSFGMGVKANVYDNSFCTHEPQPSDSQVIILLDILKHFGYPYRFASRWYGNNPCYHWTSIRCYEEKITIIDLANQNLSAQLEILDVSHNNLSGNISIFSSTVKLDSDYNSFLGVSRTISSSGGPNARDFSLSFSWITNIVLIGMVTIVVVVVVFYIRGTMSIDIIRRATKDFNEENIVGTREFAFVYRGDLDNKRKIAVKRMKFNPLESQQMNESEAEIDFLSKIITPDRNRPSFTRVAGTVGYLNPEYIFSIMWHARKRTNSCSHAPTHPILLIAKSLIANMAENYQQTYTRGGSSKGVHEMNNIFNGNNMLLGNKILELIELMRQMALGGLVNAVRRHCGLYASNQHFTNQCSLLQDTTIAESQSSFRQNNQPWQNHNQPQHYNHASSSQHQGWRYMMNPRYEPPPYNHQNGQQSNGLIQNMNQQNQPQIQPKMDPNLEATINDLKMQIGQLAHAVNELIMLHTSSWNKIQHHVARTRARTNARTHERAHELAHARTRSHSLYHQFPLPTHLALTNKENYLMMCEKHLKPDLLLPLFASSSPVATLPAPPPTTTMVQQNTKYSTLHRVRIIRQTLEFGIRGTVSECQCHCLHLHFSINNLGDPFIESNYGVHSRQFEVGVLDWFAQLWELEKNKYWGYITNCGTKGNLHGILVGREVFLDGILYASRESHYYVFKAAQMYRMECVKVDTLWSGEIDCDDFKAKLLQNQDKPAIINVNIGKFLHHCFSLSHSILPSSYLFHSKPYNNGVDDRDSVVVTTNMRYFVDHSSSIIDTAITTLLHLTLGSNCSALSPTPILLPSPHPLRRVTMPQLLGTYPH